MAQIKNIDGLTNQQVVEMVNQGGKFVMYQYCISILIMTFRRSSDIYFIRPGESAVTPGIGFTVLSFFVGWWGIPWGPIYTIGAIFSNFSGGKDVTNELISQISTPQPTPSQQQTGYSVPGSGSGAGTSGGYNVPGSGNNTGSGGYNIPGNDGNNSGGSYNIPR